MGILFGAQTGQFSEELLFPMAEFLWYLYTELGEEVSVFHGIVQAGHLLSSHEDGSAALGPGRRGRPPPAAVVATPWRQLGACSVGPSCPVGPRGLL